MAEEARPIPYGVCFCIVELVFLGFVSNSTLLYCDYLTMHFQSSIIF